MRRSISRVCTFNKRTCQLPHNTPTLYVAHTDASGLSVLSVHHSQPSPILCYSHHPSSHIRIYYSSSLSLRYIFSRLSLFCGPRLREWAHRSVFLRLIVSRRWLLPFEEDHPRGRSDDKWFYGVHAISLHRTENILPHFAPPPLFSCPNSHCS